MKKRVLLVDDEPRVRASLRTVLEPTYEILEAADAAEGLKSFKHDAPDLVLLEQRVVQEEDRAAGVTEDILDLFFLKAPDYNFGSGQHHRELARL